MVSSVSPSFLPISLYRPQLASTLVAGLLVLGLGFKAAHAQAPSGSDDLSSYTITVAAAGMDRTSTVISFPLPTSVPSQSYHLEAPSGASIPLQVGPRRAWFILDTLSATNTRTYQIETGPIPTDSATARLRDKTVDISVDGASVLRYWAEARPLPRPDLNAQYKRGGYLHPVRTPSGRIVTGDYPEDHPHHHGIWSAWTNTEFRGRAPDFWNMGEGTGSVEPMALDSTWSGPVHAGLQARHRFVDRTGPDPVAALYEKWTLRVYRLPTPNSDAKRRVFDLHVKQTTASASPLTLPTYHYGGVAVRGPDAWYGGPNARFLTAAGDDRAHANETRTRWTYFGGTVDDVPAGIAMLGHPDNFRAPQPVRIPPDMPYFTFAPSQLGSWTISPGRPYEARYRFVTFDGPPDAEALDHLWRDYAYPPTVTVSRR